VRLLLWWSSPKFLTHRSVKALFDFIELEFSISGQEFASVGFNVCQVCAICCHDFLFEVI